MAARTTTWMSGCISIMNIFGFTKDNTISRKVMEVVQARIVAAQARYDEGCEKIDEDAAAKIEEIQNKAVSDRDALAENLASSVLSS